VLHIVPINNVFRSMRQLVQFVMVADVTTVPQKQNVVSKNRRNTLPLLGSLSAKTVKTKTEITIRYDVENIFVTVHRRLNDVKQREINALFLKTGKIVGVMRSRGSHAV